MPQSIVAAAIIIPLVGALLSWGLGRAGRRASEAPAVLGALGAACASVVVALVTLGSGDAVLDWAPGTLWALRADALSALVATVVALVGLAAIVFAGPHLGELVCRDRIAECRLPNYYAILLLCMGLSMWATFAAHLAVLFVALEAAVLALALLVGFYWEDWAFTVRYRFVLPLLIGTAFTLAGFVLLGVAATHARPPGADAASVAEIGAAALRIAAAAPGLTVWAIAMLIIGLGTKAALAPFHAWIPEAHAEASAPVGAMISGVSVPVGLYALLRLVGPFCPLLAGVSPALMTLGAISMLFGILMVAAEHDLRRLLAYSTLSASGFVALGLGVGGPVGVAGAILAMLAHAPAKALLCLAAGAVERSTGSQALPQALGLRRLMPVTSGCFLAAALAVSGWPPFAGFWAKLSIAVAAAGEAKWWAVAAVLVTALLALVVVVRAWTRLFAAQADDDVEPAVDEDRSAFAENGGGAEEPPSEPGPIVLALMVLLALACVALAFWPGVAHAAALALGIW